MRLYERLIYNMNIKQKKRFNLKYYHNEGEHIYTDGVLFVDISNNIVYQLQEKRYYQIVPPIVDKLRTYMQFSFQLEEIYHETQNLLYCGLHAVNNVFNTI